MGKKKVTQQDKERMNFAELAKLEDELHEAERAAGKEVPLTWWQKLGDRYFYWQDHRERHLVNRRTYLILTLLLGWAGIHRFYEKRWKLGIFYLVVCWTGFSMALAVVDFMIALPMKTDEDGRILI